MGINFEDAHSAAALHCNTDTVCEICHDLNLNFQLNQQSLYCIDEVDGSAQQNATIVLVDQAGTGFGHKTFNLKSVHCQSRETNLTEAEALYLPAKTLFLSDLAYYTA
jgi:hypothetical protein